ncbi:MAG: hypothetical protein M1818_002828 [Claussenomyces sp. TS43310]|nr:MAG: hypothetical protein M1818_002828 [Claussenomyces sp. TS43310]
MSSITKKRTLDAFFASSTKKARASDPPGPIEIHGTAVVDEDKSVLAPSSHATYPFPIPQLPVSIISRLDSLPAIAAKVIDDQADLDLLYFQPYFPPSIARLLFEFLRSELPFYRVEYDIKRGGISTHIRTPRFTTVFGLDETSLFDDASNVIDATTGKPYARERCQKDRYYLKYPPRPIPTCLDVLRRSTEAATGCTFNFCLVNYYASGSDSISYHSDDEHFLGLLPAIASFSLGARRDFLMKHKPFTPDASKLPPPECKAIKLPLTSGDLILMRGTTQSNWLHSIPKRSGRNAEDGGRINITFRKALVKGGTENYYNYNVGTGPVFRWDRASGEMKVWKANA